MTIANLTASPAASQLLGTGAGAASTSAALLSTLGLSGTDQTKPGNPVDSVQISDQARAMMKKAQADKVIADRLLAELDKRAGRKPAKVTQADIAKAAASDLSSLLDAAGIKLNSSTTANGVAMTGDPTLDIGVFDGQHDPVTGRLLKNQPGTPITDQERAQIISSFSIDEDPATQAAIKNGTLQIWRAEDVPNLDFKINAERVTDGSGNIIGQSIRQTSNSNFFGPEGQPFYAVDPAYSNYTSATMWEAGLGSFLVSWERQPTNASK